MVVPRALISAVEILRTYAQNPKERRPLVAIGGYGCGRGHYVAEVLREFGYRPVWMYEPAPLNDIDMDGNRMMAVYDLEKFCIPSNRCIVFAATMDDIPAKIRKEVIAVGFPYPTKPDIVQFMRQRGLPERLADGNPTYSDASNAALAYEMAGVDLCRESQDRATWENFKRGGAQPVETGLFSYYAAYHLRPVDDDWNFVLWLQRFIPAAVHRSVYEAIRLHWTQGPVNFPEILRVKKSAYSKKEPVAKTVPTGPPPERNYTIDW